MLVDDYLIVDRRSSASSPQKGDVIVFEHPKDPTKNFMKRVVAIGGKTVEIRNKQLFINGNFVNERYVVHEDVITYPASEQPRDNFGPLVIPADSYFAMGDNRDASMYSRFWGVVAKTKVKGIVRSIYWSWDKENNMVRWDRIGSKVLYLFRTIQSTLQLIIRYTSFVTYSVSFFAIHLTIPLYCF